MTTLETPASARSRRGSLALTLLLAAGATVLLVTALTSVFSGSSDEIGWDYRTGYRPAAEAIRTGESPYPDPDDGSLDLRRAYVYPPQLAIALVPLSDVSDDTGTFVVFVLSVAALLGALAVVGVRDLRCFAAVLLWAPTWNALITLNVSCVLALGVACVWRYRATLWPLAAAVGAMVSIKLFLAPLVVWLALTRRALAAGTAAALAAIVSVSAWAAIGFAGLHDYPDLLSLVERQENYAVTTIVTEVGLGRSLGRVISVLLAAGLLLLAVRWTRRRDEERGYLAAVVATLVLSPVVWLHYLTLLIAPLGVLRPRFSALWLVPIVLWVSPRDENGTGLEPLLPMAVVLMITVLLVRPTLLRREPSVVG